jgi:hypothetical protein
MKAAFDGGFDPRGRRERSCTPPPRVSDEDFLRTIRHDLAAVYTDVLRAPIPARVAAVLASLENAVLAPTLRV